MSPQRIIIMRHCDKYSQNTGTMCDPQGYTRACLLAGFNMNTGSWIPTDNCYNHIKGSCATVNFWQKYIVGSLNSIFAPVSSYNKKGCQTSNRMCLIMEPTAYCYNKIINKINNKIISLCVSEYKDFADIIYKECSDTVIIAYEHEHIPLLVNYILSNLNKNNLNGSTIPPWPKESSGRFDLVFIIDNPFTKDAQLSITTQKLGLIGDNIAVPSVYQKWS
jgi:hypothetical protein